MSAENLYRALFDGAIKDLQLSDERAYEAWAWVFEPPHPGAWGLRFLDVCAVLGIDPDAVRDSLEDRGLGREPARRPIERVLRPGVGSGGWTKVAQRKCVACPNVFRAFRPDTKYCLPCHQERHPWKKRRAA